jgi:hypothetical protein
LIRVRIFTEPVIESSTCAATSPGGGAYSGKA